MDMSNPPKAPLAEDQPITLQEYADHCGRSLRSVQRDVKAQRIPFYQDRTRPGEPKMTTLAMIREVREAQAAKALKAFMQREKL